MKQIIFGLSFLLLFGCSTLGKPNVQVSPFTEQFFEPTTKVDVFKLKPPEQAYIEVAELSVRIKKSNSDREVHLLTEEAKSLGADAIILKGERDAQASALPKTSSAFNPVYNFKNKKLYAVAIKYKSTLANLPLPTKPRKKKSSRFKSISEFTGKVVAISDADIIKVMFAGEPLKVRLAEIDCPERTQVYNKDAKEFTTDMVFGKMVSVRVMEVDRFGVTVGEVILGDGRSLNRELVGAGLAWWDAENSKDQSLEILELNARRKKIGLWADANPVPPWTLLKR